MQYLQNVMRNEPVTFLVLLLLVGILAFGVWDVMHAVKR